MRTLRERVIHTALFEILAIAIVTPGVSWLTAAPIGESGMLSLLISFGAVLSNYLWTMLFDRLMPTRRRGFLMRAVHAAGLELIIASFTIPLIILFTAVPLREAVFLDVAAMGFFVAFSMLYNAAFDAAMVRVTAHIA